MSTTASRSRTSATGHEPGTYRSGHCGPRNGPCQDGRRAGANGAPKRYCPGVVENGAKVTPRYLYCSCPCHVEVPEAAHPERRQEPALTSVVAPSDSLDGVEVADDGEDDAEHEEQVA